MLKEQKNTQSALGRGWGGGPSQDFQKHLHFTFPRKTASFAYVVQRGLNGLGLDRRLSHRQKVLKCFLTTFPGPNAKILSEV